METRKDKLFLIPPSDRVGDMLRVSAEITIELVSKISLQGGGKCR